MSLTVKSVNGKEVKDGEMYDLEVLRAQGKKSIETPYSDDSIGAFVKSKGKWVYVNSLDLPIELYDGIKIESDGVILEFHEKPIAH